MDNYVNVKKGSSYAYSFALSAKFTGRGCAGRTLEGATSIVLSTLRQHSPAGEVSLFSGVGREWKTFTPSEVISIEELEHIRTRVTSALPDLTVLIQVPEARKKDYVATTPAD